MLQIGSRSIFDSEHDAIREMARNFFADRVVPFHDQWEKDGQVSREVWLEAGKQGLLCSSMPEEYGGMGSDVMTTAIIWEEQAYSLCTGPGFSLHSDIVAPYILHYGTDEQKQKYLPKLASGEWIGAIAMTEPSGGSDLAAVHTSATADGSDYLITGSKIFITNGAMADIIIVVAKTDASKGPHGVTLFIVESDMPGFTRGRKLKKMGVKGNDTSELFFDQVRVNGKEHLLGQKNKGFYYLMSELPQERLLVADMGVAAAEASFEITRSYLKERKAFGEPLIQKQVIRHKLAELKSEIAIGRSFTDRCIQLHNLKQLDSSTASIAKYKMSDLQNKVADECVQLHGGFGYMDEYPISRAFTDARCTRIYAGTNEIMKELISREIAK